MREKRMEKSLRKDEAIREFNDRFCENIKKAAILEKEFTVDEMMAPFRGRCPFRVYLPSKPERYGMKIYAAVGVYSTYISNISLYRGSPLKVEKMKQTTLNFATITRFMVFQHFLTSIF